MIVTSANQESSLFVCLSDVCLLATLRKNFRTDLHKIFREKVANGPLNKRLNFGGDPDHRLDTGIVFRIHHYWEIPKMVNVRTFIHTDSPDGGTGKTRLDGGMHCSSASSYRVFIHEYRRRDARISVLSVAINVTQTCIAEYQDR